MMRPTTGTILIVVIVCGLVLGGVLYWETTGSPSPLCGGCYRYNAPGCIVTPCPGQENLIVETSQVNSPTNMTLNIRNAGSVSTSFVSYTVHYNNNQFTKMNPTEPSIGTNQVAPINIVIDGNAFTFRSKYTYTINLTTSRNTILTFTITA
ncbi:hypothetical protein E6H35_06210 [Candidatus Bathyarchaeota archaeon]|nr:MAG: hypothetical protein E6H35_06210 [Candidatus Bathyarchaeota archaeon]